MFIIVLSVIAFFIVFAILFSISVGTSKSTTVQNKIKNDDHINVYGSSETIYCVMVTGKVYRTKFAEVSIKNFKQQTHQDKKLIIINEGKKITTSPDSDILEICISNRKKKGMTLGDMRNLAFEFIPEGALWTLWDDDDWRSDDYLSYLYGRLGNNDYVFFTKRIEHNLNTNFTWVMELKSGFVIMFGRKNWRLKYDNVEYNEDILLKKMIKEQMKYIIIDNNPMIYIRFVHNTNTSVIANKKKYEIKDTRDNKLYFEYDATRDIVDYVKLVITKNYNILD